MLKLLGYSIIGLGYTSNPTTPSYQENLEIKSQKSQKTDKQALDKEIEKIEKFYQHIH
jgi:hypothetical protein